MPALTFDHYLSNIPQRSPTVSESISDVLRNAIMSGLLKGGEPLRQDELARKLGVSRVPLREALLRLEGEGLVQAHPHRGVVVTCLTTDAFQEILEMRLALESLALELAAKHFGPDDLAATLAMIEADEALMRMLAKGGMEEEFESRWGKSNWAFHQRLYLPMNRPRLLASIENLHQLFARHMRMCLGLGPNATANRAPGAEHPVREQQPIFGNNMDDWAHAMEEHRQLALACAHRDADQAKALLRAHILDHGVKLFNSVDDRL